MTRSSAMQSGARSGDVAAGHHHHITFEFQGQCAEPQPGLFEPGNGARRHIELAAQSTVWRRHGRLCGQYPDAH